MDAFGMDGKFQSISQRVASSYRRMLATFCPILSEALPAAQQAEMIAAQQDLHAFFIALYDALYSTPEAFGLPLTEDIFLLSDHGKDGPNKTDVKKVLDRPRKLIEEGLLFLRSAARTGQLQENMLVVEPGSPALSFLTKKPAQAWINGLAAVGLAVVNGGGPLILSSERFPRMLPALVALAQACDGCENPLLGAVFFARCDFNALHGNFRVDPTRLFHVFPSVDQLHAAEMHTYFTARGYEPIVCLEHIFQWDVKYQGKKTVKASPLFQIIFDERMLHPMRTQIKIASAPRVAPVINSYSQALQNDFAQRVFPCQECGWCNNKKGLQHPMQFSYQDQERKICWYVNPDIDDLTPHAMELVKEYAKMHEELG